MVLETERHATQAVGSFSGYFSMLPLISLLALLPLLVLLPLLLVAISDPDCDVATLPTGRSIFAPGSA
jgi:hypothetical protein